MLVDNLYTNWSNKNISDYWFNNKITDCSCIDNIEEHPSQNTKEYYRQNTEEYCRQNSVHNLKHRLTTASTASACPTSFTSYTINTKTSINNKNSINYNKNSINYNKNSINYDKKLNNNNYINKRILYHGDYLRDKNIKRKH